MPAAASNKIAAIPSKSAQDPARSPTFAPRNSASRKQLSDQAMGDICASVCSTGGITKVGIMIPPRAANTILSAPLATVACSTERATVAIRLAKASAAKLVRSEEHTSELQSRGQLVCRLL